MYNRFFKRAIDFALSGIGIIVLSPLFLFIIIFIKIDSKGPIFFRQKRVGKDKKYFNILKFRTMKADAPHDVPTHLMDASGSYITRVGKVLRKTSLDELPQMFNIFKGQMSIIGPRPALWNQYDLIEERDKYGVNGVMPGLTGWAQINGRDELPIAVKARLDGEYVKRQSFFFDARCFIGTVFSVLKSSGVKEGGFKTAEDGKLKILVVSQYYSPEPLRVCDFCEGLKEVGHDVSVLTGLPNYPQGYIYDGYKGKDKRDEIINGVKVHRVKQAPRKKSAIHRFLNYYSFARASKKYVGKMKERYDLVIVYQLSPVMMASAALKIKKLHQTPVMLYCLDLWPESLIVGGVKKGSLIYKHYHKVAEKIYKGVDKILVSSRSFSDYFEKEFGIKDTVYLPQFSEENYTPQACAKVFDGTLNVMFAGTVGAAQGVDRLIKAAAELKGENGIKFHIVGDGTELLNCKRLAEELGANNVVFYGWKTPEEMAELFKTADLMVVCFGDGKVAEMTLPHKVQTYFAAGKPVLAAAEGETKDVIEKSGAGFICRELSYIGLAQTVKAVYEELKENPSALVKKSENAYDFYADNFTKDKVFNNVQKQITELLHAVNG